MVRTVPRVQYFPLLADISVLAKKLSATLIISQSFKAAREVGLGDLGTYYHSLCAAFILDYTRLYSEEPERRCHVGNNPHQHRRS